MNGRATTSLAEQLTAQFYAWEKRGRGWQVWDYPAVLEPPFVPFVRYAPQTQPIEDDARHPGLVSRLWTRMRGRANETTAADSADLNDWDSVAAADDDGEEEDLVEYQLTLPETAASTPELAERLILSLGACAAPVAFELLGFPERVVLQFAVRTEDAAILRTALATYIPEAVVTETRGFLATAWRAASGGKGGIVDFGLSREFMLPLGVPSSFTVDPLLGFLGALQEMTEGERGLVQVLFTPTAYPWAESALRAITDGEGAAFFIDAPETVNQTAEKIASPLFAAVVRVAARAKTEERAWQITRSLGSGFAQLGRRSANELIPLENDNYPVSDHEADVASRRSHRSGMLLSARELAAIVHLPSPSVRIPSLRGSARTTKAAPAIAAADGVVLGENTHRGKTVAVKLGRDLLFRHVHVIGATGTGKSTLLKNLIRQEIESGQGVALLDPHGDLVEDVLGLVPEKRYGDVVLFDPSDEEFPIGFNILRAHTSREKDLLASDLVAIFRRFSTSWGDQMTAVLGNAILAFLESEEGGTLLELRRFLIEREFREKFLKTVSDPQVPYFWEKEFPLLAGRPQMPILTRLDAFLRQKSIRFMVVQKEGKLDLGAVMDEGKIFLAKLAQGAIGEENAHLLGSLLVAKFHQMALAREGVPESSRRPFTIVTDEAHHFATPSLGAMLAGTRKYHVGLVLAHQEMRQLRDSGLEGAVLTNPATRICFRVGDDDARKLAEGFASFAARDLQSLSVGEAICRIERADQDFNVRIPPRPTVEDGTARRRQQAIRERSRLAYGVSREVVVALLAESYARSSEKKEESNPRRRQDPTREPVAERRELPSPALVETLAADASLTQDTGTETPRAKPRRAMEAASAGRGGAQHKYLQTLLKHLAEEKGFRASLEATLPAGGRVDVLLERDGQKIAVEISITSTPEQELANLEKCLGAGIDRVVIASPDRKVLKRLGNLLRAKLGEEGGDRVLLFTPDELLDFLGSVKGASEPHEAEAMVLGYRVMTKFGGNGTGERSENAQAVAQTIVRAMRRLRRS